MQPSYATLFERIRQKCQHQGWYGGDLLSSTARQDDPQRTGFAFPPASEEQLAATESALGFSLSPLLRAIYAEVANGGFGPGTGLRGAIGGEGSGVVLNNGEDESIVGCYASDRNHAQLIDLADYEWQALPTESVNKGLSIAGWYASDESTGQIFELPDDDWPTRPAGSVKTSDYPLLRTEDSLLLPYEVWPQHLLRICDMGCMEEVCIDPQGQLFLAAASEYDGKYLLFRMAAPSFEQWLEDWLHI